MEDQTTNPSPMQHEPVYDPQDPATWPDALDAVAAAPGNHTVLLENAQVRVTEITVPPGEREPVHHHRWPSVLYIDKREAYRSYDGAGTLLYDSFQSAAVQYPITLWMEPQPLHFVENTSTTEPIHLIRVEIKR